MQLPNSTVALTDAEFTMLQNTTSDKEWNAACDAVKSARNGQYPFDWYAKILASGELYRITSKFSG